MRIQQYIVSIAFLMVITGCTKDFDLNLETVKPLYVIEGKISNMRGPYYVRITKSTGLLPYPETYYHYLYRDSAEAVKDALVIITDDTGIRDTLIPAPQTIDRYAYYFRDTTDNYRDLTIDSVFTTVGDRSTTHERGYYQTTKLKGLPGHTYYLEVQVGDTIFRSSAYMPPVPALEHAELRDTTLSPYLNSGNIPVAYFKDPPNEKNYYALISNYFIHAYRYDHFLPPGWASQITWNALPYYVFDDKILTTDVNVMPVRHVLNNDDDPYRPYGYYPYVLKPPYPIQVRLQSLTKEAYDYFNILNKQSEDDGNIYKPMPSSASGNISGGALGLFYATHISDRLTGR